MNNHSRNLIASEFRNCVNNTIERISGEATHRPFHTALLSEDAIFWSRFERSFSTSFGQRVIEKIASVVALSNGATGVERQKTTYIDIDDAYIAGLKQINIIHGKGTGVLRDGIKGYIAAINAHIEAIRAGFQKTHDWNSTITLLRATPLSGHTSRIRVISDMWWKKEGTDNYISLKTVKPNIDQTAVAKKDCLHLTIDNPRCNVYFGLPYNPYGENKFDYAFNPPMGIFDFRNDPVVLIGKEMWDTIGGDGCYEEILEIAREVGRETRQTIVNIR